MRQYTRKHKKTWKLGILVIGMSLLAFFFSAQQIRKTDRNEWNLILVNQWHEIPKKFQVSLAEIENGHKVDERIKLDLQKMVEDARLEGLSPIICSSYRTNEKQQTLFNNKVQQCLAVGGTQKEAEQEASMWVAVPGTSEHQTGLAVDIVSLNYQILDKHQEETPEQRWLMNNAYKYGFILRYPSDKSDITGINYEPWHYRYVGKDAAEEIYHLDLCLEEYLKN